jgi:hypothetical protein
MAWFSEFMPDVVRHFRGPENRTLSKPKQLRWGNHGSLSVDLKNGSWVFHDHELGKGGGVIDFLRLNGYHNGSALDFMKSKFNVEPPERIEFARTERSNTIYQYVDGDGVLTLEVVRVNLEGGGKTFRQRIPVEGGGYDWKPSGKWQPIPYRLPELISAKAGRFVFIVEGEKCADRLADLGFIATTNAGGAKSFQTDIVPYFEGRNVVIIPDMDKAGFEHLKDVKAKLTGVAASIRIITLPGLDGAKNNNDVADWFDQGHTSDELREIVKTAKEDGELPEPPKDQTDIAIKTVSLVDLMDDNSPEEPDYISPDFLGQGNFCLIAGPPKAQKSFLLTEMLVACATGESFLNGKFKVVKPLKVFYLQAEMNRKLLRRRAKMMGFITQEQKALLQANLVVTERLTMQLTETGSQAAIEAMKHVFPDGGPDIIAIDPLANLFDGENEDKAPEIMKFLTQRLEVIRRAVNPHAAIILVHHSAKKSTEDMARDPFVAIRGSGALRGYYDTGIVIYRKSEDSAERQIHFELRNGESPEAVTAKLNAFGNFTVIDTSSAGISRKMAIAMLEEIDTRWNGKNPLSMASQAGNRYAPAYFARKFEVSAEAVKKLILNWLDNDIVEEELVNSHSRKRGLRKLQNID